MSFEIVGNFPEGYLDKEKIFCKEEEDAFYQCNQEVMHPDKVFTRNRLLSKRAEFKKQWNKGKIK